MIRDEFSAQSVFLPNYDLPLGRGFQSLGSGTMTYFVTARQYVGNSKRMDWGPWFLHLLINCKNALQNSKTCYTAMYSFPSGVPYLNLLHDIQNLLTPVMRQLDNLELTEAYPVYGNATRQSPRFRR